MDKTAFYKLTYGLYILSSRFNEKNSGCIVNTLSQVTAEPAKLSVAVNKDNFTCKTIKRSGIFAATALTQSADMDLIGEFGFKSSETTDKFAAFDTKTDVNGVLYVPKSAAAVYSCKVVDKIDLGSHMLFIGEATEASVFDDEPLLTYEYYQTVKKGGTPPKAPSYKGEQSESKASGFQCGFCGYVVNSDSLADDFVCPICGQSRDMFKKI